jgi:phosphonate transport system permease protein
MRFGILPQVLPVPLSHVLYYFESNTRSATILGVVGPAALACNWPTASASITGMRWAFCCMILLTVSLIDQLSKTIRRRFI